MSAQEAQIPDPKRLNPLADYEFAGDSCTVRKKKAFIKALNEHGSVLHAAQASGVPRRTVYFWAETDEEFAQAVADCKEDTYDELETSVYKRAFKSDLLAMFYLKAHRPKYRDKIQVDLTSIQDEIDRMVSKMDEVSRRQLPQAITEFIDTDYSESTSEYQPISPTSPLEQKEESSSRSTCNIPNSE